MEIEELKGKKLIFHPAGQSKGFLKARILDVLKNQALTGPEIEKKTFSHHSNISTSLMYLRKKGIVVAFYTGDTKVLYYTTMENADNLGIKYSTISDPVPPYTRKEKRTTEGVADHD